MKNKRIEKDMPTKQQFKNWKFRSRLWSDKEKHHTVMTQ